MAKKSSSLSLFVVLLCALAPVSVLADRYQARFELVNSVGLAFESIESPQDALHCSPESPADNLSASSCSVFAVSLADFSQHELTLSVDGEESLAWSQADVSDGRLHLAFADEVSLVLQ